MTTPIKAALDAVRHRLLANSVLDSRIPQALRDLRDIEQHMEKLEEFARDIDRVGCSHEIIDVLEKHADIIKDARHE